MGLTPAEYISLAGVVIALVSVWIAFKAFVSHQEREKTQEISSDAISEAKAQFIIDAIKTEVAKAVGKIEALEGKRQDHEIECVKWRAEAAAEMRRLAEILTGHGRDIGHLKAQIRNVAPGGGDRFVEYPGIKDRPK